MSISYVNRNSAVGKSVQLTGVTAGNLIVCLLQWADGSGTPTISDGSSTWAYATVKNYGTQEYIRLAYCLSSVASGTVTYTWTAAFGAGHTAHVIEASSTVGFALDTINAGANGSGGTNSDSANATSAENPMVAFGAGGKWSNLAFSSATLDGTAVDYQTSVADTSYGDAGCLTIRVMNNPGTYNSAITWNGNAEWAADLIAFKESAGAGGVAHPYTGSSGVGAITRAVLTEKSRSKVPGIGGVIIRSAATVKVRGKVPTVGGGNALSAGTVKARGRAPSVGGSLVNTADASYSNATLYIYTSGATQVRSAETEKSRGKVPSVGGEQIYAAGTEYSSTFSRSYNYVGEGVIVFSNGSTHAVGKVYESGGALVFSGGAVYSKTSPSATDYSYTGLSSGTRVYSAATLYLFIEGTREERPVTVWTLESKPPDGYAVEALPGRPAGQDGAYTDPTQDGIWDEYPVDGAYTDIGYFKEFKPFHRATMTSEGVPSSTSSKEGKPN